MAAIIARIKNEPVLAVGFVLTLVALVAQQLLASGIVTSQNGINWLNFIVGLVPLISALIGRNYAYGPQTVDTLVAQAQAFGVKQAQTAGTAAPVPDPSTPTPAP